MAKSQRSSGCYSPRGNARALARGKLTRQISSPMKGEDQGGGKGAVCKVADLKTRIAKNNQEAEARSGRLRAEGENNCKFLKKGELND